MSIVKIILLQLFWYLSIKFGETMLFPLIACLLFLIDWLIFKKAYSLGKTYLLFSILLMITGVMLDIFLSFLSLFSWKSVFYPYELLSVWIIFPCYYYHFFQKFFGKKIITFVVGAIFGPIAYLSGGNINNSFVINNSMNSYILLSILWGLFFSLSIYIFQKKVMNTINETE